MAIHEMLGEKFYIEGQALRLGHLRRESDLGVASVGGLNSNTSPAYLVRLSDRSIVRRLSPGEDFDRAILET